MKMPKKISRIECLHTSERTNEEKEYLAVWRLMRWYRSAIDQILSNNKNDSHKIANKAVEYEND